MKRKNKLNINKLIFEFISVSFAVLIALFINEWNSNNNNERLAERAMDNIRAELEDNQEILFGIVPNHKAVLYSIDSLINIIEGNDISIDSIKSINFKLISSSSWEMAALTQAISYMDIDVVTNLAKVYNFQTYYESIVKDFVLKSAYDSNENIDREMLLKTKAFLETVIPMEEDLESYCKIMLEQVLIEEN